MMFVQLCIASHVVIPMQNETVVVSKDSIVFSGRGIDMSGLNYYLKRQFGHAATKIKDEMYIFQLKNRSMEVSVAMNYFEERDCLVCMDRIESNRVDRLRYPFKCRHIELCRTCLDTWTRIKTTCPVCRSQVNQVDIKYFRVKQTLLQSLTRSMYVSLDLIKLAVVVLSLTTVTIACLGIIMLLLFGEPLDPLYD